MNLIFIPISISYNAVKKFLFNFYTMLTDIIPANITDIIWQFHSFDSSPI